MSYLTKKAQGNVLLSIFFIIIVLITVFLFTNYHEIVLVSNFNMNQERLAFNSILVLRDELIKCYGLPLSFSEDSCPNIDFFSFDVRTIESELCDERILYENNVLENALSINLFTPIRDNNLRVICPGQIRLYY